jgi:hypothetical protein
LHLCTGGCVPSQAICTQIVVVHPPHEVDANRHEFQFHFDCRLHSSSSTSSTCRFSVFTVCVVVGGEEAHA